jgi:type I restriction enzyme, S subunit
MSKVKLIPDLRFPEFKSEGEWTETILGSVVEMKGRIGYRGYTTEDIVDKGKGAITLSPSNFRENGQLNFDKCTYISWAKYDESPEIQLEVGQTVLVKTASVGKTAYVDKLPEKATVNPQIVVLKPKTIHNRFLSFTVSHKNSQTQIRNNVGAGAIPNISQEIISKIKILIPPDRERKEQQKIASCLSSLDEVITAHSQRLELLKDHKKGLMQNLFPQEGETVPKYRFKEFEKNGEWVEEPLSSKVSVIDGDRGFNYPKAEEYSSDGYCLFLNAKNVTKSGFVFNELQFITKEKDELLRKGKLSRFDIVLTTRGSLGQFAFFDENIQFENIRINSGMVILRAKDNRINPNYLYSYFNSNSIQSTIKSQGFGNAVQQLTVAVINNFNLRYPYDPKEQQKIAECLSSLDNLITAQEKKIGQLRLHKKGLMQGLFPKINN